MFEVDEIEGIIIVMKRDEMGDLEVVEVIE